MGILSHSAVGDILQKELNFVGGIFGLFSDRIFFLWENNKTLGYSKKVKKRKNLVCWKEYSIIYSLKI